MSWDATLHSPISSSPAAQIIAYSLLLPSLSAIAKSLNPYLGSSETQPNAVASSNRHWISKACWVWGLDSRDLLQAMNSPLFPTRGKCSVSYRHRAAQALVQLPAAPVEKALSALAPVVWVNVGQLRAHGIALQVYFPPTFRTSMSNKIYKTKNSCHDASSLRSRLGFQSCTAGIVPMPWHTTKSRQTFFIRTIRISHPCWAAAEQPAERAIDNF